jgi:hypothetical protein|uniref:Uncharacterized protein n=1 Tax=Picea glauca TaxID=3330 RepID=A0A101M3X8_PICGL|nr:hypothetical protein ABT39_MTgene389 [Picea glauca]QHR92203.1 hypothetical protein Q903MT_gene6240 [Picea sitchensis]
MKDETWIMCITDPYIISPSRIGAINLGSRILLDQLQHAKYFTQLDLKLGYITKCESKKKAPIRSP